MAQNEIQSLTLYGGPTGGTCDLIFDGQTASGVAYDSAASAVESALEALSNIGAGNVSCSGGPWPGSAITCEFVNDLAEMALPEIIIDPSSLTGSAITMSVAETNTGGQDLDTSLIAYWDCEESSGDLLDSEGSYDLTESSTVSSVSGIVSNGRYGASAGYFQTSGTSSKPLWQPNRTRTIAGWFKSDNVASDTYIWSSFSSTTYFQLYAIGGNVAFAVKTNGGLLYPVIASSFGTISPHTWYHVAATMNASTGEIGVAINGQLDTTTVPGGVFDPGLGAGLFQLRAVGQTMDEWGVWDGRILTSDEISALYNMGTGRTYPLSTGGDEIQTISATGAPSSGSFILSYSGFSESFSYDATASAIETGLESLAPIGSGNVTCSGGPLPGSSIAVTFTGDLGNTDVPLLEINYDLLLSSTETTQDGSPTPSQASAVWSSSTLTPHITGGSAAWTSGDVTASGNVDQATSVWSGSDLQAPGIVDDTLPTSAWSSGIVSSAVLTEASAAWSSGTAILPGVFSAPAQANWRVFQFAVLPDYPVMAYWKTKSVTSDYNPLNIPTATWSSGTAQPAPSLTGYASAAWSTTEVTLELTSVPVTAIWSTGSDVLSPVLTEASAVWSGKDIITPLFADSAYIGMATFRIIDTSLLVLSFTGESITQPDGFNGAVTSPEGVSGTLTSPEGVSGAIA